MERIQYIAYNWTNKPDKFVTDLGTRLLGKFYNNPAYSKPPVTEEAFKESLQTLTTAIGQVSTRVLGAAKVRDRARADFEALLTSNADYAGATTPARPDLWESAGWELTKGETSPRPLSQPATNVRLVDGQAPLTLEASCDQQPGMYGYLWRVRPRDMPAEQLAKGFCYRTEISRLASVVIGGLDAEVAYCVQCAPWNDTAPLQWSAAVTRIVQ
ncbi:hypothetical protein Q5H93_03695 [Hymenobacter sp. ASUV-10]|uniref:Fibronectin type III domain-containing protein n=1 Tax=Hymenobacter aranciens TaxID=3063996 RepID=A0ABT9BBA2_9BACT|nr:hypothetical protein [Hymenobacter sp. ASUV-10]MDO7873823.1 hypothetical protein [Hymenobacter sp. ASUV-10]